MQTRCCLLCGSRNTYAVSSRAKVKCDAEGKVMKDTEGNALEIMCRKCRTCGKYYFEETEPQLERLPKEMQALVKHTRAYMESKKNASKEVAEDVQEMPEKNG